MSVIPEIGPVLADANTTPFTWTVNHLAISEICLVLLTPIFRHYIPFSVKHDEHGDSTHPTFAFQLINERTSKRHRMPRHLFVVLGERILVPVRRYEDHHGLGASFGRACPCFGELWCESSAWRTPMGTEVKHYVSFAIHDTGTRTLTIFAEELPCLDFREF